MLLSLLAYDNDDGDDVIGNARTNGNVRSKFQDADQNVWNLEEMIYDVRLQEAIYSHFLLQFCLPISLHPKGQLLFNG